MAIVQLGALVSGIRGSVGGVTFRNSKAGIVALQRPIGHKATTQLGYSGRSNLQNLIIGYRALSSADKSDWIEFGELYTKVNMFGNTRILSGINWYTSINYYRDFLGVAYLSVPPTYTLPQAVPGWSISVISQRLTITIDSYEPDVNEYFIWYISGVYNSSSTALTSQFRIGGFQLSDDDITINITSDFNSITGLVFRDIIVGGIFNIGVGLRMVNIDSGLITELDRKVLSYS
jgi:hypothetical protein